MSRAGIEAHIDGDCDGWTCHYCAAEEYRERAREEAEAAAQGDDEEGEA